MLDTPFIDELDGLLTETIFHHRFALLEGYHQLGQLILNSGNHDKILEIASALRQRPETVHYCIELAKRYPDLNSIPDGKNVSWYKITKTLPPYEKNTPKKKKLPRKPKK